MAPPDLASVLATLAQFAPPEIIEKAAKPHAESHAAYSQPSLDVVADPRLQRGRSNTPLPDKSVIDPATITEWSAGLRCMSKIAAQNQSFAESIRMVGPCTSLLSHQLNRNVDGKGSAKTRNAMVASTLLAHKANHC